MGIGALILTFLLFVTQEMKTRPSIQLATKSNLQARLNLLTECY